MGRRALLDVGGHWGHRRGVGGLLGSLLGVFLCTGGQLRVGSMAEAHQTKAAVQRRPDLGGRRGRQVLVVLVGLRPVLCVLDVAARLRTGATVFGGGMAGVMEVLGGLVQTLPVGALEEPGGIEGASALEILLTAPGTEGPQRHCWSQR